MLRTVVLVVAAPLLSLSQTAHDYPIKPVPFTAVHVNDTFWAPKIETNRKVTIPFAFDKCETTGRVGNFIRAAQALRGEQNDGKLPGYPFDDTDIYKVIEGASYTLSVDPDPKLETYVDSLIAKIAAAQEADGYIYTARTINPKAPHKWSGTARWELEEINSHELYDLGHLYEAAVAYYQATGKRSLLDISLKSADLLDRTFGPGKKAIWPGHQITEMGLVKLYRVTGKEKYLQLAKFMLDVRGQGSQGGRPYNQSQQPVVDQTEAVGHAVRATYMYSGMADVAAMTGDAAYVKAIDRIWENVVGKKLYVTGGIGATGAGEAFGKNYELPNLTAYNETCASIGNDYWNERLFLLHGDAKYVDVMERTLYNGLISGVSLDGKLFFYPNPLESTGHYGRSPWFGVACCPGNITRFMASVPGYVYGQAGDMLYVNLYVGSNAEIKMDNGQLLKITQQTRYPWDGGVKLTVNPDRAARYEIKVRIPGWARNEPVPSDLYRFVDGVHESASIQINGKTMPLQVDKGYVSLNRTWKPGDVIQLNLPMPIRRVLASDQVEADRGRVAIQRGPIVYAAEGIDNPSGKVRNLMLPANDKLSAEFNPGLLNGVEVVKGKAIAFAYDAHGAVTKHEQDFTAIPYYAWANRGLGQMIVWLPGKETAVKPLPYPTLATTAKVTTSGRKDPWGINDGEDTGSHFDWWPKKNSTEWAQYQFEKPASVSEAEVYWFDDTGAGEVRVPASWRILYKSGDEWKPVDNLDSYSTAKDRYNKVTFKRVTTDALRLEVTMQPQWSAGIAEWKVK
jgi:uncharacterized protein